MGAPRKARPNILQVTKLKQFYQALSACSGTLSLFPRRKQSKTFAQSLGQTIGSPTLPPNTYLLWVGLGADACFETSRIEHVAKYELRLFT